MALHELALLSLMFAGSLLVEVRVPLLGISGANVAVPLCAAALWWIERASTAAAVRRQRTLLGAVLLFYVWIWIAAAAGEAPALSARYALKYSIHLIVFASLLVALHREGTRWPALKAAYATLVVIGVLGIIEYFVPECLLFTFFRRQSTMYPRVSSLLVWPNQFGVLTSIAIALGISLYKARQIGSSAVGVATPVLLLALALSGSRNGWLLLLLLLLGLSAWHLLSWRQCTAIAAAFVLFLMTFTRPTTQLGLKDVPGLSREKRIAGLQSPPPSHLTTPVHTMKSRLALWSAAWSELKTHPISGIGPEVFANTVGPTIIGQHWINTHSLFVNVATETGLVGLALFLLFLVTLFRAGDVTCWSASIPLAAVIAGQVFDCFNYDHAFMTFSVFFAACYANTKRARVT